jgi:hypothetical protein
MKKKLPRDPIGNYQRNSQASRRLGGQSCACGETRPEALIAGRVPPICWACARKQRSQLRFDWHHPAGEANHPSKIPIPVNDHRAELSPAQYDWPTETLENPRRSPLLAGAACIRGYSETNDYLVADLLLPKVEMLEVLDAFLKKKLGPEWWVETEMERFAPKRKPKPKGSAL